MSRCGRGTSPSSLVDPTDHNRLYKPGFTLTVSTDGGESFSGLFGAGFNMGSVHSDHHALWINPANPYQLFLGTDGGAYISEDRAKSWRHVRSLPVSQFYHVSHDLEWPYNVYGGLQDNGSWKGPSRSSGGITGGDWEVVGQGDGFWAFADPNDVNTLYVEYQGGQLSRVNVATGESKSIKPFARDDEEELRFNWNTPIHLEPDRGRTRSTTARSISTTPPTAAIPGQTISPDLTTDDPARQRQKSPAGSPSTTPPPRTTPPSTPSPSRPSTPDVIWVGTDDGLVQLSRDAGAIVDQSLRQPCPPNQPKAPGSPRSPPAPTTRATAFVDLRRPPQRRHGAPRLPTDDFGATWESITGEGLEGYVWTVKQDPVNPALLYAGTEFGLFISSGRRRRLGAVHREPPQGRGPRHRHPPHRARSHPRHPRSRDLHHRRPDRAARRSPPRSWTPRSPSFPPGPAPQVLSGGMAWFGSDDEFVGRNPDESASINYWLARRHLFGDLKIEVYDADGELITTLPGKKRRGINRVGWPMRLKPPTMPPANALVMAFQGPRVPEGEYTFKLIKGKETLEGTVELVADPRNPHPKEDRLLQQTTALDAYDLLATSPSSPTASPISATRRETGPRTLEKKDKTALETLRRRSRRPSRHARGRR